MKIIGVTYDKTNGEVFQHFGHTEDFKVYEVDGKEIKATNVVPTNGSGHGALADFLKDRGVDTLICGGIGGGAQMALTEAGIKFYGGVTGKADDAVAALLEGKLEFVKDIQCNHHDHEGHGHHEHNCGHGHGHGHEHHHCGDHGCGNH